MLQNISTSANLLSVGKMILTWDIWMDMYLNGSDISFSPFVFRLLQEAQDIFGVDFDYEEFQDYEGEESEEEEDDEVSSRMISLT